MPTEETFQTATTSKMSTECATEKRFYPRSSGKHRATEHTGRERETRNVAEGSALATQSPSQQQWWMSCVSLPDASLWQMVNEREPPDSCLRYACVGKAVCCAMLPTDSDSSISYGLWMFSEKGTNHISCESPLWATLQSSLLFQSDSQTESALNLSWPSSTIFTFLTLCRRADAFPYQYQSPSFQGSFLPWHFAFFTKTASRAHDRCWMESFLTVSRHSIGNIKVVHILQSQGLTLWSKYSSQANIWLHLWGQKDKACITC